MSDMLRNGSEYAVLTLWASFLSGVFGWVFRNKATSHVHKKSLRTLNAYAQEMLRITKRKKAVG